jgi:hypothetical protein
MADSTRFLSWFSCGAASAVATKIALIKNPSTLVVRCVLDNEHADNNRFAREAALWFGKSIINLRSDKYVDCWDLWHKRRYLNGPRGALCTVEMKKIVRRNFSLPSDVHIFGFTFEEENRAERFVDNNPDIESQFPLVDYKVPKKRCYEIVQEAGMQLPAMYRLGYNNANCIGCVKGGAGYWNKIRKDFPRVFIRMAALEREIGASCIKGKPLATLDPEAGRHKDLALPDCGLFCGENGGW